MPTIGYYFSSCPDTEYMPDIMVEISDAEFLRREQAPLIRREETGRTARKEISLYDAMLAEIYAEHDGEKAKVRNRRKADRKNKLTPKMRKEQEYMRNWNVCMKMVNFGTWDDIPIVEGRVRSAEKIARADWEIESAEIAEEEEWERFNRELEEFDRQWREQAEAEQRKMREYRKMVELNEWLKWA